MYSNKEFVHQVGKKRRLSLMQRLPPLQIHSRKSMSTLIQPIIFFRILWTDLQRAITQKSYVEKLKSATFQGDTP